MFSPIIWLWASKWWKKRNNIEKIVSSHVMNNAKEFFCWYNPPYWHNKFWFEVSTNGRFAEHEQITDYDSLQETIQEVHKHNIKIMWNINHRYYTDVVEKEFTMMIDDFLKAWIDGFIIGSMWALEYLDEISEWTWEKGYIINWKKIQLNISTILAVYNEEAIEFLKENYPIYKVILSREVTIPEIEKIITKFPELIFEVFGEGDFCRYNNWLCFAEHKYTDRDICTVVVNDLITKKAINYDFRKIIQDKELSNNEKVEKFDNTYENEYKQLENAFEKYELTGENLQECWDIFKKILQKHIIYYDSLKWVHTEHNKNIDLLKIVLNHLLEHNIDINLPYFESLENFKDYLDKEIKYWKQQSFENIKELNWWKFGVKAKYKDNFYNRADNLNLYSYVFFDKFENIDTVKFPTRWRNYLPKIQLIDECVKNEDKIFEQFDMNVSFERANYNLKYLFDNDRYWFYDIRKKIHNSYKFKKSLLYKN